MINERYKNKKKQFAPTNSISQKAENQLKINEKEDCEVPELKKIKTNSELQEYVKKEQNNEKPFDKYNQKDLD